MQSANEKTILTLLILMALSNVVFFVVGSYSGPIVGFVVATATAFHWWRKKDSMLIIVMAIVWIFLHIYELVAMGVGSHPVLFYLNVLLPALLFFCGLKERRRKSIRSR